MAGRLRVPPVLDVAIVDDPRQMAELNRSPAVSRVVDGSGGLLHRAIHRRIYRVLHAGGEPLAVFAARESAPRAARQAALTEHLGRCDVGAGPVAGEVGRLARYVATGDIDVPLGVAVQQLAGRLVRPDYVATEATYAAAEVVNAWPRANPLKALAWRWSGKLGRSRTLLWERAGGDPACIHATAIAFHNVVASVERLREAARAGDAPSRRAADVARSCLVAPSTLLRSVRDDVRVPSLARPLRKGTLLVFKLGAMRVRTRDPALAFARGEWNQCPAHDVVPRLLEAIWTRAMSLQRPRR